MRCDMHREMTKHASFGNRVGCQRAARAWVTPNVVQSYSGSQVVAKVAGAAAALEFQHSVIVGCL